MLKNYLIWIFKHSFSPGKELVRLAERADWGAITKTSSDEFRKGFAASTIIVPASNKLQLIYISDEAGLVNKKKN